MAVDFLKDLKRRMTADYKSTAEALVRFQSLVSAMKQAPKTDEIQDLMDTWRESIEMNQNILADISYRMAALDKIMEAIERKDEDSVLVVSTILRTVVAYGMKFLDNT